MKIGLLISLGIPPDESSFLQLAGRCGRSKLKKNYDILYYHHSKFSKIPKDSLVRDLIMPSDIHDLCIRQVTNSWFSNDEISGLESHLCCSFCMSNCVQRFECTKCTFLLNKYEPKVFHANNTEVIEFIYNLEKFQKKIKIGKRKPHYVNVKDYVEALIDLSLHIKNETDILTTYGVSHRVASMSMEWIESIRSNFMELEYQESSRNKQFDEDSNEELEDTYDKDDDLAIMTSSSDEYSE